MRIQTELPTSEKTHDETRPRRERLWLIVGTVIALIVTAVVVVSGDTAAPPEEPGGQAAGPEGAAPAGVEVLRIAADDRGYPSPFAYLKGPGLVHTTFLFDTLLWKDSTGELMPWLATDWEVSDDGTEYRFTLRDDVTFHDGEPLTADDVAFTFAYRTDGPGADFPGVIGQIPPMQVTAEGSEVVFALEQPFAPFLTTIAGRVPIMPQHVWEGVADPPRFREPQAVTGSGPYRLESWDQTAGTYLYVANENYFLGEPHVKRLEFRPIGNELQALRQGEIDLARIGIENLEEPIPDAALAPFASDEGYEIVTAPGEANRVLYFNLSAGFPFDDVRFRQAVAYGVDRQDLVDRILFGRGEVGSAGGMAPSHPMTPDDLPTYDHDPERAAQLLDGIGIVDADGDGVRDLPDRSPLSIELQMNSLFTPDTGKLISEHLRAVGLDVRAISMEQQLHDQAGIEGNYQMSLYTHGGLGGDPDFLRFRVSPKVPAKVYWKQHGYDNPAFEEVAARQLRATGGAQRAQLVGEMERIIAEDVPFLSLYVPSRILLYDSEVFDSWYFTPGALMGLHPGPLNKHAFLTGQEAGL